MPQQSSVGINTLPQLPGVVVTSSQRMTGVNDAGSALQVDSITVTSAVNATTYTFTIDAIVISILSAASGATTSSIRDQLIAEVRDTDLPVEVAANPFTAAVLHLTATVPGVSFAVAESDSNLTTASVVASGTTEAIPFGLGVVVRSGGGDDSITLPSGASDVFQGAASKSYSTVDPNGSAANEAVAFSRVDLVKAGQIWVSVDEAIAVGDPAFLRYAAGATGAAADVGLFRTDLDTNGAFAVNGTFETSTTGRGVALLNVGWLAT